MEGSLSCFPLQQPRQDGDKVQLFSQAWLQSVTPANVGFKTCGVYSLNCSAIKVTNPFVQEIAQIVQLHW